jgi:hypothetical protein
LGLEGDVISKELGFGLADPINLSVTRQNPRS